MCKPAFIKQVLEISGAALSFRFRLEHSVLLILTSTVLMMPSIWDEKRKHLAVIAKELRIHVVR